MIKPFEGLKCNYMTGLQFCFKRLCKAHHALKINWGLKVELTGLKPMKGCVKLVIFNVPINVLERLRWG